MHKGQNSKAWLVKTPPGVFLAKRAEQCGVADYGDRDDDSVADCDRAGRMGAGEGVEKGAAEATAAGAV